MKAPFFISFLLAFTNVSLGLAATTPSSNDRLFCGRLLIIISGAGSFPGSYNGKEGVDAGLTDPNTAYTFSNFHQFRRNNGSPLRGYSIAITSDPVLRGKLTELPTRIKEQSGLLGVLPASVKSFHDLLSNDPKVSLVERAFSNFAADPTCQQLATLKNLSSVLPLIKTEIVITSMNQNGNVPLWKNDSDTGSVDAFQSKNVQDLDGEMSAALRAKLGPGLVHIFVESCSGTQIGSLFSTPGLPSSLLSTTDSGTLLWVGGTKPPTFRRALRDKSKPMRALTALSPGATSLYEMQARLSQGFTDYRPLAEDPRRVVPIFDISRKENPLMSLSVSSTDAHTEKLLKAFARSGIEKQRTERLLAAGFRTSLPPPFAVDLPEQAANADLRRVLAATAAMRKALTEYHGKIAKASNATVYESEMEKFRTCIDWKSPPDGPCGRIGALMRKAEKGTDSAGEQTVEDQDFLKATIAFVAKFDAVQVPNLLSKYRRNELGREDVLRTVSSVWGAYDTFEGALRSYALYTSRYPVSADLQEAIMSAQRHITSALENVQQMFAPFLVREALETRLSRIEETAKLLVLHDGVLEAVNCREELRAIADDLECSGYPVGPAFDKAYGERLRKARAIAGQ